MTAPAWPLLSAFFQSAMSCPVCGKHCRCAEPRAYSPENVSLVDVDAYDPSEEQFASSVMTGVAVREEEEEQMLSSGTLESARARYGSIPVAEPVGLPLLTNSIGSTILENPVPQENEWRDEVASRLQSYKARRRRQGDDNMAFNFESTAGNHVFLKPEIDPYATPDPEPAPNYYAAHAYATEPVFESPQDHATDLMDHTSPEQQASFVEFTEPEPTPAPAPETAKLIFFPKPPMPQQMRNDELAEPVFDTPRILDAPEEVESEAVAIPLADITLHPEQEEDPCVPYVEPELDLPVRVAPVGRRVFAELLDTLFVLLASGVFGAIVAKISVQAFSQEKHAFLGMVILVPAIFWSMYKYMFLVHNGTTLGMQIAQLRLVYFDGQTPAVAPRRYRALSMLVSIFPLGLGLLWSFVDPDRLCWHDRISRTYMAAR